MDIRIADTTAAHLPAIADIYARAAQTPATFDLEGKPLDWWKAALQATNPTAGHLMLTALGSNNDVLGYVKTGPFRDRAAYDTTVETGIYVHEDARGQGVGHALYNALIPRLNASNAMLAVAGVTQPNDASNALHAKHGFAPVGTFHGVGHKHGRAWDVTFYELALAS